LDENTDNFQRAMVMANLFLVWNELANQAARKTFLPPMVTPHTLLHANRVHVVRQLQCGFFFSRAVLNFRISSEGSQDRSFCFLFNNLVSRSLAFTSFNFPTPSSARLEFPIFKKIDWMWLARKL
jgi:hypothetical protein